jgi:hypothetical protein
MPPRNAKLCSHMDSFRYAPKLLPYSEGSCQLDPGYCKVRDGLGRLGDDLGAASTLRRLP